ncbi:MAG: hypothetical protein EZS28_032098, partial [Streblomastix strix]
MFSQKKILKRKDEETNLDFWHSRERADSKPSGKMNISYIKNRSKENLEKVIKKCKNSGTRILSDMWKGYD